MFTHRFLTATLVVLTSTACSAFRTDPAVEVTTRDVALNSRWHASLASPASLAGAVQMKGSASMAPSPSGNSTTISVKLGNASPGGVHPWSVHWGQCGVGMDKGLFGPSDAYKSLAVASDGDASGSATVAILTPRTGDYFVVVRASATNFDTIVACGNLAPPTQ